ncbi:DRTGG domain-containing protein [Spirochaeta africana]|uniref:DRTGG domain-containing protein n=1 Tax=Spirochaeta africana (strain ATCC 700263 / DSM 8902 / Z-7692) TaxID=889378 RepID=H9ULP0_SPIAZ|nr:DRTGG domain-containing protein [Spirochaeta africana]AFG38433.1 DRTGG domain-containing protein [Spirochaeta africana DSM 8902]
MKHTQLSLDAIREPLELQIFCGDDEQLGQSFVQVLVCDLMSDVLTVEHEDFLLVTSLTSDQVARTADIVGAVGIVLVNGKTPQPALVTLAEDLDIPVLGSRMSGFDFSVALGKLMEDHA